VAQRDYKRVTREYRRAAREQGKNTKWQEGAVSEHSGAQGS